MSDDLLRLVQSLERRAMRLEAQERKAANTLYVDPTNANSYATLSAALAAAYALTPSTTNEFLIVVSGEVAETAALTARSHVHVLFLPGASVTVTSNSTLHAVGFTTLTNTTWAAVDSTRPTIIRAGTVAGGSHGLSMTNCDSSVRLINIYIQNTTTGVASCHGALFSTGSTPTVLNCTFSGGSGGATCYGIYCAGGASPTLTSCTGVGGSGGTTCYGILMNASSPTLTGCTGVGGSGGTTCYGIYMLGNSAPTLTGCTGRGGSGGTTCHGIHNATGSTPSMTDCTGIGGSGGNSCYGLSNSGSNPSMTGCTGIGGDGGISCHGINNSLSSMPIILRCLANGGGSQNKNAFATIAASARTDDSYRPTASHPYRVLGAYINVTAGAAAGVTLTLRDAAAGGGNALSAAVAVTTTGSKYVAATGWRTITAGSYFYGNLSSSDSTLAYTITYVYTHEYATCYALYDDSDAGHTYQDCSFASNGASAAIYVTNNGDNASLFAGGVARSGLNSGTRPVAFACQSAWNPGQVYNMALDGKSTNLTAAAGTANGSNIEY